VLFRGPQRSRLAILSLKSSTVVDHVLGSTSGGSADAYQLCHYAQAGRVDEEAWRTWKRTAPSMRFPRRKSEACRRKDEASEAHGRDTGT